MRKRAGFTLVELLVVIVIIVILAALLFPVYSRAREKARQSVCLHNQRQVCMDITIAVGDNKETFPGEPGVVDDKAWRSAIDEKNEGIFNCPSSSQDGSVASPDYGMNFYLYGMGLGDVKEPTRSVMTADAKSNLLQTKGDVDPRHNKGFIVSFVDEHVKYINASEDPFMWGPGEEGTDFNCGAVNVPVTFTADNAARSEETSAFEGQDVLITNESSAEITAKVKANGSYTPAANGFNPATADLKISAGKSKAFPLFCYTDSTGERVDTEFVFGEDPNAVTITVAKPRPIDYE